MKNFSKILYLLAVTTAALTLGCSKKTIEQPEAIGSTASISGKTGKINIAAFVHPAGAATYYVAPTANGGDPANDGTSAHPITLQFASDQSQPGDLILLKSGNYTTTDLTPALNVTVSGTAAAFITYKAADGQYPVIKATGSVFDAVRIKASYIIFDGIELIGNNAAINTSDAYDSFQFAYGGGSDQERFGKYNTDAINIGLSPEDYKANPNKVPHYVIVRNCKVHDFSSSGIVAAIADNVTIEDNVIYNNGLYTMYGGSGISTKNMVDWDGNGNPSQYKTSILRNVCHDNKSLIPYLFDKNKIRLSDGNGIIIDSHIAETITTKTVTVNIPAYQGRTLVANNICYLNGGSGAHALTAPHTDIVNNTCYQNGQTDGPDNNYANVYAAYCSGDVKIYNNIAVAKYGGRCTANTSNGSGIVYGYNYLYAASSTVINGPPGAIVAAGTGVGDINQIKSATNPTPALPNFVNAGSGNFNVNYPSYSINAGSNTSSPATNILSPYPYPTTDFEKLTRLIGTRVDLGAFEYGN